MRRWHSGQLSGPCHVGIDPSLTGFSATLLYAGGWDTYVFSSKLRGVERLQDIRDWLLDLLGVPDGVSDVAIEGTVLRSPSASVLGELSGVVKLAVWEQTKIRPLMIPPMSLKKYVAGTSGGKSTILLNVYKKWGAEFNDDNAADSFALAHMVAGRASLAYEHQVIGKLTSDDRHRA